MSTTWLIVLLVVGLLAAFPLAIVLSATTGCFLGIWKRSRFRVLVAKRFLTPGKKIVHWPAKDIREDIEVVDLSRIDSGFVGVKRRRYGVYRAPVVLPSFGPLEFVPLSEI